MQTFAWILWIAGVIAVVLLIAAAARIMIGQSTWLAQRRADRSIRALRTFDTLAAAAERRENDQGPTPDRKNL